MELQFGGDIARHAEVGVLVYRAGYEAPDVLCSACAQTWLYC